MSNLLEKVISTSTIGGAEGQPSGGGLLAPQQSKTFIDYMFDATVLGSQVRTIRMTENEIEVDTMAVGERLVRLATEAVADHVNAIVTFAKVSLTTKKLRLDWELSSESLEDNLEGEALEDHVARLMANAAANDLEDLAINGNVNLTDDALLKSFDGWRKRLYAGGHVLDNAGGVLDKGVFNKALRAMPRDFMKNRGNLKFFSAAGLIQDYLFDAVLVEGFGSSPYQRPYTEVAAASARSNVAEGGAGWTPASPFGVSLQEVNLFPEYQTHSGPTKTGSDVWLVDAKNLIWGVKREIRVYREYKPKKDTIEYTMFTRVGAAVGNPNAAVVVKNVSYKD